MQSVRLSASNIIALNQPVIVIGVWNFLTVHSLHFTVFTKKVTAQT